MVASRIMHLAVTSCITKVYQCKDKNRLELGTVLPDAATAGNSHMKIRMADGKNTYDLTGFRSAFMGKMQEDDLYLGYYLHLVQDLYFRDFVYHRYGWNPFPPGNVERIHRDYALVNQYVIEKYALADSVTVPASFDTEPINGLGRFDMVPFLEEMRSDFKRHPSGKAFFFTSEMADEFILYASEKCKHEMEALIRGQGLADERMLAW